MKKLFKLVSNLEKTGIWSLELYKSRECKKTREKAKQAHY